MSHLKPIRISILGSLAAGLLWIGAGAAYAAADDADALEDPFITRDTPVNRFAAQVNNKHSTVITFEGSFGQIIPGTKVRFTQHRANQPVLVTFVAEFPKPTQEQIPAGSFASGVDVQLVIDGQHPAEPIGSAGGVVLFEGGVATASSVTNGTHGFTFVTGPLPAGDHVIEVIAFGPPVGPPPTPGSTFVVGPHTTVVQHD
jgi:hypothetical protein